MAIEAAWINETISLMFYPNSQKTKFMLRKILEDISVWLVYIKYMSTYENAEVSFQTDAFFQVSILLLQQKISHYHAVKGKKPASVTFLVATWVCMEKQTVIVDWNDPHELELLTQSLAIFFGWRTLSTSIS